MMVSTILRGAAGLGLGLLLACGAPAFAAPTPSQMAVAKQVVVLSGIARSFDIFVPKLSQQIMQLVSRTRPELADDLEGVLKQLQPEFEAHQTEIADKAAAIFAEHMTEAELTETAAFFGTSAGKKYVDQEPIVLGELVSAIHVWSNQLSQTMMMRVHQEMKKKGRDF